MSSNGPLGRYQDRVSKDADDIAGFFTTRLGQGVGLTLLGVVLVGTVITVITGWFS